MKKILVTGGAGYIGSHTVVELVNSGYEPVIVDNYSNSSPVVIDRLKEITGRAIAHYEVDCCDHDALNAVFEKEGEISGIIHFAAFKAVGESVKDPLKYYHNNVGSLVALLRVMQARTCWNLVFSSSCTVYGQPEKLPVNESFPRTIESPYGNSKKVSEEVLDDLANISPLRCVTLRYFNPIGAHPSSLIGELPTGVPNNLVPFITQTAIGKRVTLTVFGNDYNTPDGSCIRDYIHVVDLAKAHVKALEHIGKQQLNGYNEIFNIGTGRGNSVLELVNTFERVTGKKLNYIIGARRAGDVEQIYSEVTKAEQVLGWKAQYTLEDALVHAWNWEQRISNENQ